MGTLFKSTDWTPYPSITENIHLGAVKENSLSSSSAPHLTEEQILDAVKKTLNAEPDLQMKQMFDRYRSELEGNHRNALHQQKLANAALKEEIDKIQLELLQMKSESARNTAHLMHQTKRCCTRSFIEIEGYVNKILRDLLGSPNETDLTKLLRSMFVAKQDLELHLANLTQNLRTDFDVVLENNGKVLMDRITKELEERIKKASWGEIKSDSLTDEYVRKIVADALAIYDADKTGLVDYAMEPSGGQVISTRCTESYNARTSVLSIFGIPIWFPSHSARIAISPGMSPGECWAFQNFPGFLVIKLVAPITVEAFSMEHISKLLVSGGKVDSAPRAFSVYGLRNETDHEPVKLGDYVYDIGGEPLQYFAASVHGLVFSLIELQIHSNHGNPNYTCLYRFRVHGTLAADTL